MTTLWHDCATNNSLVNLCLLMYMKKKKNKKSRVIVIIVVVVIIIIIMTVIIVLVVLIITPLWYHCFLLPVSYSSSSSSSASSSSWVHLCSLLLSIPRRSMSMFLWSNRHDIAAIYLLPFTAENYYVGRKLLQMLSQCQQRWTQFSSHFPFKSLLKGAITRLNAPKWWRYYKCLSGIE